MSSFSDASIIGMVYVDHRMSNVRNLHCAEMSASNRFPRAPSSMSDVAWRSGDAFPHVIAEWHHGLFDGATAAKNAARRRSCALEATATLPQRFATAAWPLHTSAAAALHHIAEASHTATIVCALGIYRRPRSAAFEYGAAASKRPSATRASWLHQGCYSSVPRRGQEISSALKLWRRNAVFQ